MVRQFVVVCEANPDFETATLLADRVLCRDSEFAEVSRLESSRTWSNHTSSAEKLYWRSISHLAKAARIRAHGYFDGKPGAPDAAAGRRAIRVVMQYIPNANAIILIRDMDDEPSRATGLRQARDDHGNRPPPVVIGAAITKRECWHLAGFEPRDEEEAVFLATERQTLGRCPCQNSHLLTAKHDGDNKSAKRVLKALTRGNYDRQKVCVCETALETLESRGAENGLAAYLSEVSTILSPLIKD